MTASHTLGCDPGLSGAVALLDPSGLRPRVHVWEMPTLLLTVNGAERRRLDMHRLAALFMALGADSPALAVIEDLSGRPSTVRGADGKPRVQKGMWEQGFNCAAPVMAAAAAAIPYRMIRPAEWKGRLGVPADKDGARLRASQLFPDDAHQWARVKDDGKAEAAMLALYAFKLLSE